MPGLIWSFVIIHFLLYPASNGYNGYFDKDEGSIGGLKHPPKVNKSLYYTSLILDVAAVVLGFWFINLDFAIMLLIYGLVSKAYSHPSIRLKRYAITSWVITGIFQGLFTFVMCYVGVNQFDIATAWKMKVIIPGLLTTVMLWANYPMTQIYQHEEDARHGDTTISMKLGISGTFHFTAVLFILVAIGFVIYFRTYFQPVYANAFLIALTPVILFFGWWYFKTRKDNRHADYTKTMWLNIISATCLNAFFVYLFLDSSQILAAFQ